MFQISDDLDFDDEFLGSELNADVSKPTKEETVATLKDDHNKSPLTSHVNNEQSNSSTSSVVKRVFSPKSKSPANHERRGHVSTKPNYVDSNPPYGQDKHEPDLRTLNSLHVRPGSPSLIALNNPHQTTKGSFNDQFPLRKDDRAQVKSFPISNNSEKFVKQKIASEHSEFLAKWNDNDFFSPESKEKKSTEKLRSNVVTPPFHQSKVGAVTRKINKTVCQRRFPGPAGLLPPRQGSSSLIAPEEFLNELKSEETDPVYEESNLLSQSSGSVFESGAWSAMMDDLGSTCRSLLQSMNLASIKSIGRNLRSYKVPFLAVLVQSVDASLPDATVGFKDPTDEMHGVVHRDVWDQFGPDIAVGTVLVLRNVGIMSAGVSSRQHVINITGRNLTAIYSPKDELNIQLRQIHEFAANNSSQLLDEWEKVESQIHSASPISSRIKKSSQNTPSFNNNVGFSSRPRHPVPNSFCNPRMTPPSRGNIRPQQLASASRNCNPSSFRTSSPNAPRANSPFMPLQSRHSEGRSVDRPGNSNIHRTPLVPQPSTQKSPNFTVKTPLSHQTPLQGSSHRLACPSNVDVTQQQPSTSQPAIPTKKPKLNLPNSTGKINPFQIYNTPDVDALLDGIDTDSLFGDF